ncbi:MAG: HigA family addiction module antitoxin [Bifidobacterium sp.]|uniref:HigA family addiction module antitoxin n=1 Tax=Bifidobacterium fermentum TaxID=3059035 RepID=A0AB39UN37_9BIFI
MSTSTTITDRPQALSTPGEILKEEFLDPLGITAYRLAKAVGVGETGINEIITGKRRISTAMAYRFSYALGTTPLFWMNLQTDYDAKSFDPSGLKETVHPLVAA